MNTNAKFLRLLSNGLLFAAEKPKSERIGE